MNKLSALGKCNYFYSAHSLSALTFIYAPSPTALIFLYAPSPTAFNFIYAPSTTALIFIYTCLLLMRLFSFCVFGEYWYGTSAKIKKIVDLFHDFSYDTHFHSVSFPMTTIFVPQLLLKRWFSLRASSLLILILFRLLCLLSFTWMCILVM